MVKLKWWPAALVALVVPCFASANLDPEEKKPRLLELRTRKAGDARFKVPRKWKVLVAEEGEVQEDQTYLHLQHKDENGGISQVIGIRTRGTTRGLPRLVLSAMKPEALGFDLTEDDVRVAESRQGYPVAYARDSGRSEELGKRVRAQAFAMKPGRAVEVLVYLSTAGGAARYEREAELAAFVRELRYASAKDPIRDPLEPRASTRRLDLIAYSTGLLNMPNSFGGMDIEFTVNYHVFAPNGRYSRVVPDDGRITEIDWKKFAEERPTKVGVYEIQRGASSEGDSRKARLVIRTQDEFGFVKETEGEVTYEVPVAGQAALIPSELRVRGASQSLLYPLESTRLRGRYHHSHVSSGSSVTSSGSSVRTRTITMKRSGTFETTRFFSASFSLENSDSRTSGVTSSKPPATTGKYQLEGYTLTLNFDDGRVLSRFCHPVSDKDDSMLLINGAPYRFLGRR